MGRPKVIRVWGNADSLSIEFTHVGGGIWQCQVPPDTKDGQYAAQISAINEFGETAYWTGILYMCSGVCCFKLFPKPFLLWFSEQSSIEFSERQSRLGSLKAQNELEFEEAFYQIEIKKGCCHVR